MRPSNRTTFAFLLLAGAALSSPIPATSQDVSGALSGLAEANAERYVSPVFEGLGYSLLSGLAEDASVHGQLGFDFGVRMMGAWVPDEKKTFEPIIEYDGVTYTGTNAFTVEDPSIAAPPSAVGSDEPVTLAPSGDFRDALEADGVPDPDDFSISGVRGFDILAIPFVVLQAGVGLGFNTEVTVRAIPSVEPSADVGEVSAFGLGVKHEVGGWFPTPLPVDVAVTAGYQNMSAEDYLDASSTAFGLLVGRGLGPLDVFATMENVNPGVDVSYTVENEEGNPALPPDGTVIEFSPDIGSETRFGIGANMQFLILNLSALYTLGDYNVATVKAGISFR